MAAELERDRLFGIIEELVLWENTTNEEVLDRARVEIWQSWRRACAVNADHPRAREIFDRNRLPAFHDPFAGGGALPLEAQRLGLEAHASDLNPVAVLINKAMIEIPPKFAGKPPVNPDARRNADLFAREWKGVQGLAEDVRYYGQWMRDEAEKRIGHLYPKVDVTPEMVRERPDLKAYEGRKLTVIAWLWARTVKSPNPAFADVDVPLASTFVLSTKKGKEAYVEPVIEGRGYRFKVKAGPPTDTGVANAGTKLSRGANFQCLVSGTPIAGDYIKSEGKAGRMSTRLMAIVAEGDRRRVYLAPTQEHEECAGKANPQWRPDTEFFPQALGFRVGNYGMSMWSDLFTRRQLVGLTTFSDLVQQVRDRVQRDAVAAGITDNIKPLKDGGTGVTAYAEAVEVYLAFLVGQIANHSSMLCGWNNVNTQMRSVFSRQAIPMVWDFAESNPLCDSSGSYSNLLDRQVKGFVALGNYSQGEAVQVDVNQQAISTNKIVSTDPPYYDNIGYADLSDFFYVWLRRTIQPIFPYIFATLEVPKAEELVATPHRHGGKENAEAFFLEGMTQAMRRLADQAHPAFPVTIYYAFKQSESDGEKGIISTGWETFLYAVISAGFGVSGTWPVRTEKPGRVRETGSNALASSIVLVCHTRLMGAPTATRREFLTTLRSELPRALRLLQAGNIAPVESRPGGHRSRHGRLHPLRQGAGRRRQAPVCARGAGVDQTGPWTRSSPNRKAISIQTAAGRSPGSSSTASTRVSTASPKPSPRPRTRASPAWSKRGILTSKSGTVQLLKPDQLPEDWDPATDVRITAWELVHHLVRVLEAGGESAAADLAARLGAKAEVARELCYRLYTLCERKKRAAEALSLQQPGSELAGDHPHGARRAGIRSRTDFALRDRGWLVREWRGPVVPVEHTISVSWNDRAIDI